MMENFYKNKTILITGGTGSLGRALIRTLKKWSCKIIVYSRDEARQAQYFGKDPTIIRVIGDVRDFKKLDITMKQYTPDYVIHAGALKRIDDMEYHPDECIKTNVYGTENVALAAQHNKIKKCMLISTDKACMPINVYGSSKFLAERIFTNCDYKSSSTVFSSVRYGNVIASRGSFIPAWMDALTRGEKITLTVSTCTRFLFTLDDAVQTVLNSLYYSEGGEVFIPKIASYDLLSVIDALKIIKDVKSVDTEEIGIRPGEKIHEDMLGQAELSRTMQVSPHLLCVLPQCTTKNHTYSIKYEGLEMNSSLHTSDNVDDLVALIKRGLKET